MPALRQILERFRPAGASGDAARTDRPTGSDPEAELAAVFDCLEPVQAECRALLEYAWRDARLITRLARDERAAIVADARSRAEAVRAGAAAAWCERVTAEHAAVVAEAERLAAQIRTLAQERMPTAVGRVLESLTAEGLAPERTTPEKTKEEPP